MIGAGVSGLVCAEGLQRRHDVTVFEADSRLGGHTNTVRVDLDDETHFVDTGFIVYNEVAYPAFADLLRRLQVATQPSEMSFSVSGGRDGLEYRGNGLRLYAQPTNVVNAAFQRMLVDIVVFNRRARCLLEGPETNVTLGEFVTSGRYGRLFASHYLVPLGSAIWSADPATFDEIPAATLARFFEHHGMLKLKGRPQWRTVTKGAARYVDALVAPLRGRLRTAAEVLKVTRHHDGAVVTTQRFGDEEFDAVVLATHGDQALGLLADPSDEERKILGSFRYRDNLATLHTDASVLPRRRRAWASWNYHLAPDEGRGPRVTYWMNCLQRLASRHELCVSLNCEHDIDPAKVLGTWHYAHPVLDRSAVAAQGQRERLQGAGRTYFCGAYWGYGFHEDGVVSALDVCRRLGADRG